MFFKFGLVETVVSQTCVRSAEHVKHVNRMRKNGDLEEVIGYDGTAHNKTKREEGKDNTCS